MDLNGANGAEVRNSYQDFLNRISNIPDFGLTEAEDKIVAQTSSGEINVGMNLEDGVSTDLLRFTELPLDGHDGPRKLDICIQFKYTIRGSEESGETFYELKDASTWVTYLERTGGRTNGRVNAKIQQGMHFDCHIRPRKNHPVFHTQFDPTSVKLHALTSEYCIDGVDPDEQDELEAKFRDYPRIPSAPMDITGIVYLVLNDHLPTAMELPYGWPPQLRKKVGELPSFPEGCMNRLGEGVKKMVPDWWYVHPSSDGPNTAEDIVDARSTPFESKW